MEKRPTTHSSEKEQTESDDILLKNLGEIRSQAYRKSEDVDKLHNSITEFARSLQKKYSDVHSRILWHLLIGSTPGPEDKSMEDYPGEDSIAQFIEGLNPEKKV